MKTFLPIGQVYSHLRQLVLPRVSEHERSEKDLRPSPRVQVRDLLHSDVPACSGLDLRASTIPLDAADMYSMLRGSRCVGKLAIRRDTQEVVGYMLYDVYNDRYDIRKLVVDQTLHTGDIVDQLLKPLKNKWKSVVQERPDESSGNQQLTTRYVKARLVAVVHEVDLTTQRMLKDAGFLYRLTLEGHFSDAMESFNGYAFSLPSKPQK